MAERLKAQTWKVCILERVSRVRIPFSPMKKAWLMLGFFH